MTNKLEILDGMCGTGKTEGIFKWMNTQPEKHFLYVTPFLDEVTRAADSLSAINFMIPTEHKPTKLTKSDSLLDFLEEGKNIAFTHELFKNMDSKHIKLIKKFNYILIIDEECDLIEPFSDGYTNTDIDFLLKTNCINVDTNNLGKINWIGELYDNNFKYSKFRNMCNLGMLYSSKSKISCMTVHLPIGLVTAADRVILISYRFVHSIMNHFVKMKGLEVVPFTEVELQPFDKSKIKELIEILDFKNESKYKDRYNLSLSWFDNKIQSDLIDLGKIIQGVCKNQKTIKRDVMWTAPSKLCVDVNSNKKKLIIPSYGAIDKEIGDSCFVPCSSKATNMYSHKWMLVHAFNRFPNQTLQIYLRDYGFTINDDEFALSETIQWVWRSRIRKGESIKLCFIPKRMKDIFVTWLNES